jgi:6-phosphofructokinase 1
VIVVGEGAGQNLFQERGDRDASGNIRFGDIGLFLKDKINSYFKQQGMEVNLKYIDPSYTIRSLPANPRDSAFCLLLGHHAVHARMTGRTNMLLVAGKAPHVPIRMAVSAEENDPGGSGARWLPAQGSKRDEIRKWTYENLTAPKNGAMHRLSFLLPLAC